MRSLTHILFPVRLDAGLKNVELGPFEVIPKLFNALESKNFTLNDKIDFYFVDGNMVPLLVQDNYLHCKPNPPRVKPRTKGEEDLMALESFCQVYIYNQQTWVPILITILIIIKNRQQNIYRWQTKCRWPYIKNKSGVYRQPMLSSLL